MKTLIENTIHPQGMGSPVNITIFNTTDPKTPRYLNIAKLSGRTLRVKYHYEQDNVVHTDGSIPMVIPHDLDKAGVTDFHERTQFVLEMAKKYMFRGLTRLHISAWDKTLNV